MDDSLLPRIVDVDEHLQVAEDGQLHCLLQQTFLSFAIGHLDVGYAGVRTYLAVTGVFYGLNSVDSTFSHATMVVLGTWRVVETEENGVEYLNYYKS